ncbi:MAG: YbjQ family protein [Nitrososphaerota archaeon]|nr:YbjQ family protein [Candidatus Bathyarchaeota archaeon]MCX8162828.1 YbjQ family protein [Candidatus Bathyarchaeota archaeon]MDW8061965.1 YbjQ family protein [Nitrososphaerota archaeon]
MGGSVIAVTTQWIPGYEVEEILGLVWGLSVRTRGMLGRLISGIEAMVGGRGSAYLEELDKARREALEDLKRKAEDMGANAILSVDFETTEILEGFIVVTAYGTAVKVRRTRSSST